MTAITSIVISKLLLVCTPAVQYASCKAKLHPTIAMDSHPCPNREFMHDLNRIQSSGADAM